MNLETLEKNLDKACTDFSNEIRLNYKECGKEPATEHDINELARQAYYTFDIFKTEIIKYLKENN